MSNIQANNKIVTRNIYLSFPAEVVKDAAVCKLAKNFDLEFTITSANINPKKEGFLILEFKASEEVCSQAISYLKEKGITVSLVSDRIWHNEEKCMQCGICTSLCPTSALHIDPNSRKLVFNKEICTVCRVCTKICPVGALQADTEFENAI